MDKNYATLAELVKNDEFGTYLYTNSTYGEWEEGNTDERVMFLVGKYSFSELGNILNAYKLFKDNPTIKLTRKKVINGI